MSAEPAIGGFATPGAAMTRNDYLGLAHMFILAARTKPAAEGLHLVLLATADLAMLADLMRAKASEVQP
jgi:hypothetical protein